MRARGLLILVVLLLITAGCLRSGPAQTPTATPPPAASVAAKAPDLLVVSPENDQAFEVLAGAHGADVPVSLSATAFSIRPPGPQNSEGEGHFLIGLDEQGTLQLYIKQYTLRNVPPGEHRLIVQLVQNDNSPYNPPVVQTIRFIVIEPRYQPKTYSVNITEGAYEPAELSVHVGDQVVWTNIGAAPRTVTSTNNFNSGSLTTGQNFSYTFDKAAEYGYFSVNNPGMKGTITVTK